MKCDLTDKSYNSVDDMFDDIRQQKDILIKQKKSQLKEADGVVFVSKLKETNKSTYTDEELATINELKIKVVINTTNLMDSHDDVHIPGLWNKSLSDNNYTFPLLQEHTMKFDHVITDKATASIEWFNWKDLNVNYFGKTQALVFDAVIEKSRNPFMFNQYAKGYVKNHSVGMQYVKIYLALNSGNSQDKQEKETWDKYINEVANRELAEQKGYFWVVKEAKIVEGSAVVKGSNFATPTVETQGKAVNNDTLNNEPMKVTQTKTIINFI